jgi:S1-C subfamily serine protease
LDILSIIHSPKIEKWRCNMSDKNSPLSNFSDQLVYAVKKAESTTVLVNARRRIPASGIGYDEDLIVTADHVVERDEEISVLLMDGQELSASVAGRDPGSDLALLRLTEKAVSAAKIVDTEARIGQVVLALGRPSKQGIEASLGIVSAIGGPVRTGRGGLLERYIRSDTIPYPGFSGGPLIDVNGNVLGLNTSGFGHGTALTIPVSQVWQTAEVLAKHGHIRRGYLGVRSQPVRISAAQQKTLGREQESGLLLISVEEGSPAEQGGMLVGDILVGIAEQVVSDPDDLFSGLSAVEVGKPVSVELLRAGQPVTLTVLIGERS